jgi:hypothetical protein
VTNRNQIIGRFASGENDVETLVSCNQMLMLILHGLDLDKLLTPFEVEIVAATAKVVDAIKIKNKLKEELP